MGLAMEASQKRPEARILRLPDVCAIVGLGRSTVYQLEADGRFPRRVRIGLRAVGWVDREIQDWVAKRVAVRATSESPRLARPLSNLHQGGVMAASSAQCPNTVAESACLATGQDELVSSPRHRNI